MEHNDIFYQQEFDYHGYELSETFKQKKYDPVQ